MIYISLISFIELAKCAKSLKSLACMLLEELQATMKRKGMKDTAPGPDGIPYSL